MTDIDNNDSGGLIFAASTGKPFQTEKAASIRASRLLATDKIKTKVIAVEGGFALKRLYERRPKRVPMGRRNVLTYPEIPGYKTYVFNDDPKDMGQRLRDAVAAGWEYVNAQEEFGDNYAGRASSEGKAVTKPVGGGTTGVLMKKKIEWCEEDEALKQEEIDRQEAGLIAAADVEGKYGKISKSRKGMPY